MERIREGGRTVRGGRAALALFLSLLWMGSKSFSLYNDFTLLTKSWTSPALVGAAVLLYLVLGGLESAIRRWSIAVGGEGESFLDRHIFVLSFAVIFFCWLPWTILARPGSFCTDSVRQLVAYLSGDLGNWLPNHPPLFNLLMGSLVSLGKSLGDINLGVYFYLLLQSLAGALAFAYGALVMRKELGIRRAYVVLSVLFYALAPLWGCFAQWVEKDLLYAASAAAQTFALIPVLKQRRLTVRRALALAALSLGTAMLRPNGIYAVVPALVLLLPLLRGRDRGRGAAVGAGVLGVYILITGVLYPALDMAKGSIKEALSFPFQQTARYVRDHGEDVTPEERAAIEGVLDYASLARRYNPRLSDPVKATYKGDDTKLRAYFTVWGRMGLRHPLSYLAASWNGGFGYLAPVAPNLEPSVGAPALPAGVRNAGETLKKAGIRLEPEDPAGIRALSYLRQGAVRIPGIRVFCMPGFYTWILLLCLTVLLWEKRLFAVPALVPSGMTVLTCLASPMANATRYMLPVIAVAPVLAAWTVCVVQRDRPGTER